LKYRSLHHGPDVEPLSDIERQGAAFTKMDKDAICHYGPGDFAQYEDPPSCDSFDGGDSEMGLCGDGNVGLRTFGRDVSPHITRTSMAKMDQAAAVETLGYADELLQSNPYMDSVRAQQLENWATQNEIAMSNRYMNERFQENQGNDSGYEHCEMDEGESFFTIIPLEAEGEVEGIITLQTSVHSVAVHEIALKNLYMGYAKFRAGFVEDASGEWSVTPSDGFLKQKESTQFVVRYNPDSAGVSHAHLVIETEDFKKIWRVAGSTGEYQF